MERAHGTGVLPGNGAGRAGSATVVHDRRWAVDLRFALGCAGLLLTLLLSVDALSGVLTIGRGALWITLAGLLFVVLLPPRISVAQGRLSSRRLLRELSVRTDQLVSVRWSEGVSQRIVLCDTDGSRVDLDPRVLIATPELWHSLNRDARHSLRAGTLTRGVNTLRLLELHLDRESANLVFRRSGLG